MNKSAPSLSSEPLCWLTLSQAAKLLGVHPATLRRWADDGEVRCTRTPGGHRRFLEEDLQTFLDAREQTGLPQTSETLVRTLVQRTHQEVVRGIREEPWHKVFDEEEQIARRESGRRLIDLAIQYTLRTTGREEILQKGRRIGRLHGQHAVRRGLSLVDTARASFFFRELLIRATRPALFTEGAEDIHIHQSVRRFLDEVFFATLEAYDQDSHAQSAPTGAW